MSLTEHKSVLEAYLRCAERACPYPAVEIYCRMHACMRNASAETLEVESAVREMFWGGFENTVGRVELVNQGGFHFMEGMWEHLAFKEIGTAPKKYRNMGFRWLRDHGVAARSETGYQEFRKPDAINAAFDMVRMGVPFHKIEKEIGISYETISRQARKQPGLIPDRCECGQRYMHTGHCPHSTPCKRGHLLTPDNLTRGKRPTCRTCRQMSNARNNAKRRTGAAAQRIVSSAAEGESQ